MTFNIPQRTDISRVTYPNNSYPASQVYVAKVPVAKDSSDNDTLAFIGTAGWPHFNNSIF